MVWRTLSLGAILLITSCGRAPAVEAKADRPSEIWMAERAGDTPFVNDNFGIIAVFPVGAWVCPGLSWSQPHGFYTRLEGRFSCPPRRGAARVSTYGVWADWNAAFYRTLDDARGDRPCVRDPRFIIAPNGRPLGLRGLSSRVCVTSESDGWLTVEVEAFDGRWGGEGEDAEIARVHYTASLVTRAETWERDAALFATFLDALSAKAPSD